jgi:hypothetical protein
MLTNSVVIIKGKGRRESPVAKRKFYCVETLCHDGTQGRGGEMNFLDKQKQLLQ